ncbi:MAG: hypothetical protein PHN32_07755 [Actinomycetota bacterium]|jgi:hypothetical protein|nr:hypothetical protein [Actinomycetota bacterium]
MDMNEKKKKITERINQLPPGSVSPSRKYWCATCKKFFNMDQPVCPFMTKMCVNTPIAIENLNPESSEGIEKIGLFYPKFTQKMLSAAIKEYPETGRQIAEEYLRFLKDWKIKYKQQPLQTIKSFLIIVSGAETAQRVNEEEVTFVFLDVGKNWDQEKLFSLVSAALPVLIKELDIKQRIKLDAMDILGERPMGKYYCPACKMFFEFGMERDKVTCPLMAQKCMFTPTNIESSNYSAQDLIRLYQINPDIFKRFMNIINPEPGQIKNYLKDILEKEWNLMLSAEELDQLSEILGA